MTSSSRPESTVPDVDYPPAPWRLHGSMWLSLFRVAEAADRPEGLYGVAFVRYDDPSPLTYRELLVARTVRDSGVRRATITDIWVDSPASMRGGRELWAIPKELADFATDDRTSGPLGRVSLRAEGAHGPLASATFRDLSSLAPRTPFRTSTWQRRDTGEPVVTGFGGSGRTLPAVARWDFAADGPLAFLRTARRLASVRVSDFRMVFG